MNEIYREREDGHTLTGNKKQTKAVLVCLVLSGIFYRGKKNRKIFLNFFLNRLTKVDDFGGIFLF